LQSLALATQTDSQKHVTRAQGLQGAVLAARGQLAEAVPVLEAAVRRAAQLQIPRDLWLGQAALGQVCAQLGRDAEAEHAYRQAAQTLDALAARLRTPQLRRALLSAGPVLEVYTAVGSSPPQTS
jgi:Flp pilus assembly protein TadD